MRNTDLKEKRDRLRKINGMSSLEGVVITTDKRTVLATRDTRGVGVSSTGLHITEGACSKIPFVRGFLAYFGLITQGTSMLFGDLGSRRKRITLAGVFVALCQALMFSVTYYLLPILAADGVNALVYTLSGVSMGIWRGAVENAARILVFGVQYAAYLKLLAKDIAGNHGAEHKVIACFVDQGSVDFASAKGYSRFNPACSSNLISYAIMLEFAAGILVRLGFESLGMADPNFFLYLAIRFFSLPLVVMISYEIHIAVAKHYNKFTAVLALPGRLLQMLTTSEPTPLALEVAVIACRCAVDGDFYSFYRRAGEEYTSYSGYDGYSAVWLRMARLDAAYRDYLAELERQRRQRLEDKQQEDFIRQRRKELMARLKALSLQQKEETKAIVDEVEGKTDKPEDKQEVKQEDKQEDKQIEDFTRQRRKELMARLKALSLQQKEENSEKPKETISDDDKKEDDSDEV